MLYYFKVKGKGWFVSNHKGVAEHWYKKMKDKELLLTGMNKVHNWAMLK